LHAESRRCDQQIAGPKVSILRILAPSQPVKGTMTRVIFTRMREIFAHWMKTNSEGHTPSVVPEGLRADGSNE